jgi:hypothetical protein
MQCRVELIWGKITLFCPHQWLQTQTLLPSTPQIHPNMKLDLKKLLPHAVALVIFFAVACLYCLPALQGKVIESHDWTSWTSMSKDAENYAAKHGVYPQWTNGIFSGMPSYQIAFNTNAYIGWYLPKILTLGLPTPVSYFFLACICFYLLTQVLRLRTVVGILGALAFAYATYNPVIISVTHHTKMISIALMPGVLAGLFLIFDKKYWIGAGVTALFVSALVATNHLQITYYTFIVIGAMGLSYAIYYLVNKQVKALLMAALFGLLGIGVGVLSNAVQLFTTYDYAKATIRGGSALTATDSTASASKKGDGLDSSYAMSYSMSIAEPLVLAVPHLFGGSDATPLPEDGQLAEVFGQYPGLAQQFPAGAYWGGIGGTSGPPYSGAIVCILAVFGLFVIEAKHKWWMAATIALACVMSWGGYFYGFNGFLFEHLPFYNKFRAPSMALVIPQLLLPILAALSVNAILDTNFSLKTHQKVIKQGLIGVGALLLLIVAVYFTAEFKSPQEEGMMAQINAIPDAQSKEVYKAAFKALAEDRKTVALGDVGRTIGFALLAVALVFLYLRKVLKPVVAGGMLAALVFIDLITIDTKYLNKESYQEKSEYDGKTVVSPELLPTQANLDIQKDKGIYRVFDARESKIVNGQQRRFDPYSDAALAYHHNIVNGYHAAKLSLYMDLIQNQLSKGNPRTFNMLNTKYFVLNAANGQDSMALNPGALGPAWFAKGVRFVPDARAEMTALDSLNVADSAVVQSSFNAQVGPYQWDSSATIKVTNYDNDLIEYAISTAKPQFAVLSEVYYDRGWLAFADGKSVPIVKTNYALRGVSLPAGTKQLTLRFEPKSYLTGRTITWVMSAVMLLLLGFGAFLAWRRRG